ncbi:MAG: conserved membrane protein of unknown function [Promethearchaeota archaeon]|nr:MAG: conserved membrane protein of unknown function [Candidatus Lokiarchaeota archaeon]
MWLLLLQIRVPQSVFFIIVGAVIVGLLLTDIIMMKLGLSLVKAESHTNLKWVVSSFFLQILIIFIVISPVILIIFVGLIPPIYNIIIFGVLALFIEINVINIIHKTGIGRAIVVFIMIVIPTVVYVLILTFLMSRL